MSFKKKAATAPATLFTLLSLFASFSLEAQNTFPATGSVSIGTNTPRGVLEADWSVNNVAAGLVLHNSNSGSAAYTDLTLFNDQNQYGAVRMTSSTYSSVMTRPNALELSTSCPNGLNFISSASGAPITFQFGNTTGPSVYFKDNGNVGIGTASPDGVQINAALASETTRGVNNIRMGVLAGTPRIIFDQVNSTSFEIDNSTGNLRFITPGVVRMIITAGGNVGIGTSYPDTKLTVNGTIHSSEVKVDLSVPGPDYVFKKDYPLPRLEDVKKFIDSQNHLPEIPAAVDMEKNGLALGEMNMLLLKKIEELTLYVIDLKKGNDEVKARLKKIEDEK